MMILSPSGASVLIRRQAVPPTCHPSFNILHRAHPPGATVSRIPRETAEREIPTSASANGNDIAEFPSVFLPFCGKADRIVERAGFRKRSTQSSKLPSRRFTLRQNGLMPRLLLKKSSCSALRVGSKTHLMPIPFGKGSPLFLIASNWRNAREERPRLRSTSLLRATSPALIIH